MTKKVLCFAFSALLILSLAACGSGGAKSVDVQKIADDDLVKVKKTLRLAPEGFSLYLQNSG